MRLINADNIVVYIGGRINGKTIFADMVKKILDQQPTVEAIPIEWINKHIDEEYAKVVDKDQFEYLAFLDYCENIFALIDAFERKEE